MQTNNPNTFNDNGTTSQISIQSKINIHSFISIGILILSVVLLAGTCISFIYGSVPTGSFNPSQINNKELPIYCVEQSEPKIALTFDAAWAESILL